MDEGATSSYGTVVREFGGRGHYGSRHYEGKKSAAAHFHRIPRC